MRQGPRFIHPSQTCQHGAHLKGWFRTLRAAMLPAALLSLGFPKPPDYSVLSRRLSSLQSDEVCAGSVCAGKLSYPRDDLTRVSMHSFIYLFIYSSIRLPRPPSRACCSTACCHASVPRSSSCLRWRRCCAQSSGRRGSARSSFSAWTADAARYSAAASRCAPPRPAAAAPAAHSAASARAAAQRRVRIGLPRTARCVLSRCHRTAPRTATTRHTA